MKYFLVIALFALLVAGQAKGQSVSSAAAAPTPTGSPAIVTPGPEAAPSPATEAAETNGEPAATTKPGETKTQPPAGGNVVLPPEKANPVPIPKFESPSVIDATLDEPVWQWAAVLKDFYQINPGDNVPPSNPPVVLLGYDQKFLYIAFRAFDEPDKIRSTIAKRDNIWQDDYVGFYLDTF